MKIINILIIILVIIIALTVFFSYNKESFRKLKRVKGVPVGSGILTYDHKDLCPQNLNGDTNFKKHLLKDNHLNCLDNSHGNAVRFSELTPEFYNIIVKNSFRELFQGLDYLESITGFSDVNIKKNPIRKTKVFIDQFESKIGDKMRRLSNIYGKLDLDNRKITLCHNQIEALNKVLKSIKGIDYAERNDIDNKNFSQLKQFIENEINPGTPNVDLESFVLGNTTQLIESFTGGEHSESFTGGEHSESFTGVEHSESFTGGEPMFRTKTKQLVYKINTSCKLEEGQIAHEMHIRNFAIQNSNIENLEYNIRGLYNNPAVSQLNRVIEYNYDFIFLHGNGFFWHPPNFREPDSYLQNVLYYFDSIINDRRCPRDNEEVILNNLGQDGIEVLLEHLIHDYNYHIGGGEGGEVSELFAYTALGVRQWRDGVRPPQEVYSVFIRIREIIEDLKELTKERANRYNELENNARNKSNRVDIPKCQFIKKCWDYKSIDEPMYEGCQTILRDLERCKVDHSSNLTGSITCNDFKDCRETVKSWYCDQEKDLMNQQYGDTHIRSNLTNPDTELPMLIEIPEKELNMDPECIDIELVDRFIQLEEEHDIEYVGRTRYCNDLINYDTQGNGFHPNKPYGLSNFGSNLCRNRVEENRRERVASMSINLAPGQKAGSISERLNLPDYDINVSRFMDNLENECSRLNKSYNEFNDMESNLILNIQKVTVEFIDILLKIIKDSSNNMIFGLTSTTVFGILNSIINTKNKGNLSNYLSEFLSTMKEDSDLNDIKLNLLQNVKDYEMEILKNDSIIYAIHELIKNYDDQEIIITQSDISEFNNELSELIGASTEDNIIPDFSDLFIISNNVLSIDENKKDSLRFLRDHLMDLHFFKIFKDFTHRKFDLILDGHGNDEITETEFNNYKELIIQSAVQYFNRIFSNKTEELGKKLDKNYAMSNNDIIKNKFLDTNFDPLLINIYKIGGIDRNYLSEIEIDENTNINHLDLIFDCALFNYLKSPTNSEDLVNKASAYESLIKYADIMDVNGKISSIKASNISFEMFMSNVQNKKDTQDRVMSLINKKSFSKEKNPAISNPISAAVHNNLSSSQENNIGINDSFVTSDISNSFVTSDISNIQPVTRTSAPYVTQMAQNQDLVAASRTMASIEQDTSRDSYDSTGVEISESTELLNEYSETEVSTGIIGLTEGLQVTRNKFNNCKFGEEITTTSGLDAAVEMTIPELESKYLDFGVNSQDNGFSLRYKFIKRNIQVKNKDDPLYCRTPKITNAPVPTGMFGSLINFNNMSINNIIDLLVICIIFFGADEVENEDVFNLSIRNILCFNFENLIKQSINIINNINISAIFNNLNFEPEIIETLEEGQTLIVDIMNEMTDLICNSKFTETGSIIEREADRIKRTKCGVCNMRPIFQNRFGFTAKNSLSECMDLRCDEQIPESPGSNS